MKWKCSTCGKRFKYGKDANFHACQPTYKRENIQKFRKVRKVNYEMKRLYDQAKQDRNIIERELTFM